MQQASQREMLESMREQQERGCAAAEEARRAAKLLRPVLQKFTEKDNVESYLDMFERVLPNRNGPRDVGCTAGRIALRGCPRQLLHTGSCKCQGL